MISALFTRFCFFFFFFNDTATTEIYTLSLHDALPICSCAWCARSGLTVERGIRHSFFNCETDRKSTRLNSSHTVISYAVFCLKKKKKFIKHLAGQEGLIERTPSVGVF